MAKATFPTEPKELTRLLVAKAKLSMSYASELARGKREPSLKLATRLERDLNIPCRYWLERKSA